MEPSIHAVETQLRRRRENAGSITPAQLRQGKVVESLCKVLGRRLRVVDFGGAAGGHYFALNEQQRALVEHWTVIETPEMVERASKALGSDALSFLNSVTRVKGEVDVVLASSSLQYVDDFEGYFRALLDLKADFFCIDRTPMRQADSMHVYLQRVFRNDAHWKYETSYPLYLHPKKRYTELLNERYTLMTDSVITDEALVSDGVRESFFFLLGRRKA